ncbi:MAG: AIM24 family protein, partial [Spirochaetota bacterium]
MYCHIKGTGIIFVCAVGSMMTFDVPDGETIVVDNGHLVTWPSSITYDIQKASKSWFSSGVSGEGVSPK